MSEEKPTFKVTDRRLFNADGTPRADIPREEEKAEAAPESPAPAAGATAEPAPPQDESSSQPGREAAQTAGGEAESAGREQPEAAGRREPPGGGVEPESDPTPFASLVMFIAQPAAAAMGMTEHPGLAPGEVDLPLAKHCIDLLAVVKEKTRGNLGKQEQQIVEGLLAELRMQYVSLTSAPRPASPRGFTGGDITGGR